MHSFSLNATDKILNIAHRGASSKFPENTMPAFRAAAECHADMIELDVHLSKDGIPVVIHNDKLTNAPSGERDSVRDYTFDELKTIDAAPSFENVAGEAKIPSLEEVLKFANGKIALNIEIKTEAVTDTIENGIEQKCLQLLEKYKMLEQVLFSSYDLRSIQHVKKLAPEVAVAILFSKQPAYGMTPAQIVQQYNADAFHCTYHQLSKKWLENLKSNNIPILVYTVNSRSRMKKLISLGVTGIFTDKPDVLADVLKHSHSNG